MSPSGRAAAPRVRASGLTFRYPTRREAPPSLDAVDLTLRPGRIVFVLGPNGSGKSTLFKTLLGLLRPDAGEVLLDDIPVHRMSVRQVARSVSYIPQQEPVTFNYTVRATVLMGRTPHLEPLTGRPTARDEEIAEEAIQALGISHLADRGIRDISGGERQLTMLARALCQQGEVLVLDEPTASLDFANQDRVLREVRRLAATGLSVLISSHDPLHALRFADDLILLRAGRVDWTGPVAQLEDDHLSRLYGIPIRIAPVPDVPGLRVCIPDPGRTDPEGVL